MKKIFLLFAFYFAANHIIAQTVDSVAAVSVLPDAGEDEPALPVKVFVSQRLINANTVEVLKKGIMDFKVSHSFEDIAGDKGGIKNFFGLDRSTDVRIGFQIGLSNRLNIVATRAKGAGRVQQLYELGLKYQMMRQLQNDPKHPLSMTLYVNNVISTMKAEPLPDRENSFRGFGDRTSQVVQLMVARKFGKSSFQLSPAFVNTGYVQSGDDNSMFALGAAARIPLSKKLVFVFDYFHPFRSKDSKNFIRSTGSEVYDAMGAGFEILTEGHTFNLMFTNATEILENRFIPRTVTSWGRGEFRWAFALTRAFVLFRSKKDKQE
jgi:Membrane bound beta barrel domain (DUF5777)